MRSINRKLAILNLECRIKLKDQRTWDYSFEFFDTRRNRILGDINTLSAGQKAIIHLVFEAYGRGEVKGGVVVIDEPEIHLHHQFQHEYLRVLRDINREQDCQYIVVTHSDALINTDTISHVKRFALDSNRQTIIKAPILTTPQKTLIKILDNTRCTYAFFAKKVLLVEGDSDRYFFRALIQEMHPDLALDIAVLETNGKGNQAEWRALFTAFGLDVHSVNDFDYSIERFYSGEKGCTLRTSTEIAAFKGRNGDWEARIDSDYANQIYILKEGDLEAYLGIRKGLDHVIDYCNTPPSILARNATTARFQEIKNIIAATVA